MKRTTRLSGFSYSISAIGAALVWLMALLLLRGNPAIGLILLAAASLALIGLGMQWNKQVQRKRRRTISTKFQI